MITVYPNAKINLGLHIMGKRPDGYHNLETLFFPVPGLHDVLEIEPSDELCFEQSGIIVDCPPEQNLILRCYHMVKDRFPEQVSPVHIRFSKQIPFGAGLGGGSADAAFMMRALNDLFSLGMTDEQMEQMVSPLGADCAFFVQNKPQLAEGIGNVFTPTAIRLTGLWILLVKPDTAVSTREAYGGIRIADEPVSFHGMDALPMDEWQRVFTNDFETTIFPLHPEIAVIKQALLDAGALYASMSGSGATVFGLFDKKPELCFDDCFVHLEKL